MIEAALDRPSMFATLEHQAPDALLGLISAFRADSRPQKIDLGIGVFRDDNGATPVMRSVKAAEARLLIEQSSKSYLGGEGDAIYTALLAAIAFGGAIATSDRLTGVQTPGGTGALRLGAELIARARPQASIWFGTPTWPNHAPIFREAGLSVRAHRFVNPIASGIDFDGMIADLNEAEAGDLILLQACCHNPTGASFTTAQWVALTRLILDRGLTPFIDLAYQGLGDGLEEDSAATRMVLAAVPDALVAYSCDKNFGLYRERVGALWVQSGTPAVSAIARENILSLARALWSMPPDHGAAIVREILQNPELRADWEVELGVMRSRINNLRRALAAAHPALAAIEDQRGLFAMLPLSAADVINVCQSHAIYMADNGRINIAGLSPDTIPALVSGLAPYLQSARLSDRWDEEMNHLEVDDTHDPARIG